MTMFPNLYGISSKRTSSSSKTFFHVDTFLKSIIKHVKEREKTKALNKIFVRFFLKSINKFYKKTGGTKFPKFHPGQKKQEAVDIHGWKEPHTKCQKTAQTFYKTHEHGKPPDQK